ncbi:TetR/AcrR family transcriptional regulator [Agromyces sp. NPDC057679]|uniref:TetR/AcrR family transcriptional regulator n=1 Tax=Agromyces sp. NPDC057679 TaxID=3346207 RepID=UPI00366F3289
MARTVSHQIADPTLRDRQRDLTRRVITDALAAVVVRDGVAELSMQAVADEAGCSLRTLYRHFGSREDLLAGLEAETGAFLQACFDRALSAGGRDLARVLEDLALQLGGRRELVLAWAASSPDSALRGTLHGRVGELIDDAVDRVAPELAPDEHARVAAAFRLIASGRAWLLLTDQLSDEDASTTAGWIVRTLLAELARGGRPNPD